MYAYGVTLPYKTNYIRINRVASTLAERLVHLPIWSIVPTLVAFFLLSEVERMSP